jgi:hypothetical protein
MASVLMATVYGCVTRDCLGGVRDGELDAEMGLEGLGLESNVWDE